MDDLIGDILSSLKLKSAVYFKHGFCPPWGMSIPKGVFAQFHLISHGHCVLNFQKKIIPLHRGDILIFPTGEKHQIKSQEEAICLPGSEIVDTIQRGHTPFQSGDSPQTHLICGHYELDKDITHPIIENLPPFLLIKSHEYGRYDLMQALFELLVEELSQKKAGFNTVSLRLAEVLFISVIRHYYLRNDQTTFKLFKDQLIYQTVERLHQDLSADWTIQKLARMSGISRTLFIDRFKLAIGVPPMRYLSNWRLNRAKFLLKNTKLSLRQICEEIGYQSEASFNRAFKQRFEISPGKFRKHSLENNYI